jgi:L-aspartate oxidase
MPKKVDFLVIGSGIAGLTFALKVAEHGSVCVLSKTNLSETATRYAQGGIAAVMYSPDTYEKHIRDTLIAGDDLNDENIVRITITESTDRIKELIAWGTKFDKQENGRYDLGREGGHSEKRVLHHKDSTGQEIQNKLIERILQHPNIEVLENYFAIDLITQHHLGEKVTRRRKDIECYGVYVMDLKSGNIITILSKTTLIASGGAGNIYPATTNPLVSTGDGIAMAHRAKATIEKMEFIQFHPTSLYNPGERPSFLITEALRGFGGILRNEAGEEFMHGYDKRGSLAPRDIVSRAIDSEMKKSGSDHVYLDCTHLDKNELIKNFPVIYSKCLSLGIDITARMIPVVPAAHYVCGGIKVDEFARTSIKNLYASGECASTGLHGANRLASNSLLESAVFSHRASIDAIRAVKETAFNENIPDWNDEGVVLIEEMVLITQSLKDLQALMGAYVGIVRSDLRLQRALNRLEIIFNENEALYKKSRLSQRICELRNMINVAYLIIRMAMERKESRGLHYSIDYPKNSQK